MLSGPHSLSHRLELLCFHHAYTIEAAAAGVTALAIIVALIASASSLWVLKTQMASQARSARLAGTALFVDKLDLFAGHIGYLSYCALLGNTPNKRDIAYPADGMSRLLDVLQSRGAQSPGVVTDPLASRFRSRDIVLRSTDLSDILEEISAVMHLGSEAGFVKMLDPRVLELRMELERNSGKIRGPS